MSKLLSLAFMLSLFSAMSLSSFAEEPDGDHAPAAAEKGKWHGPCGDLDLSSSQKQEMKDEHFKFEEKRIDLESAVKKAHLNFEKVGSNSKSSEADIEKAGDELAAAKSKLETAEVTFHTHILAKIFKPEQREKAMKCGEMMMEHGKGQIGHGQKHHHE